MIADVLGELDVSRETIARLEAYQALVQKWTKSINLISKRDVAAVWERHIVDSAQIYEFGPDGPAWMDIGSGGGFPAVVVAILDCQLNPGRLITMVDSDQRKCVFLRNAIRELDLNARVVAERYEQLPPQNAAVLSARALGSISQLLEAAERHLSSDGVAILPKGKSWKKEHEEAQKAWSYQLETSKSKTNPEAVILKIKDILRA